MGHSKRGSLEVCDPAQDRTSEESPNREEKCSEIGNSLRLGARRPGLQAFMERFIFKEEKSVLL